MFNLWYERTEMSEVSLNFADELNRVVSACASASWDSKSQLDAFLLETRTNDGQEFVLQLLSHLLVIVEWLPVMQKKAYLTQEIVRKSAATDERIKQLALGNVIARFTMLRQALQMSRSDELQEIIKKLRDTFIDTQTFGAWKIFKAIKDLLGYKTNLFKEREKIAEWSEAWRSELSSACCLAAIAVEVPSASLSLDKSLSQAAAEQMHRTEREYDDCRSRKLSELRRVAQDVSA